MDFVYLHHADVHRSGFAVIESKPWAGPLTMSCALERSCLFPVRLIGQNRGAGAFPAGQAGIMTSTEQELESQDPPPHTELTREITRHPPSCTGGDWGNSGQVQRLLVAGR